MMCFYPIKYDNWEKMRESDKPLFEPFGKRSLAPTAKVFGLATKIDNFPEQPMYLNVKIDVKENAEYDLNQKEDGIEEEHKLATIVMHHGVPGRAGYFVNHLRELASFGYLAIGIDAHDGSCIYTEKPNGQPVEFDDTDIDTTDMNYLSKQLEIRSKNLKLLLDEMTASPMYLQEKLDFSPRVKIDQSKIVFAGHSYGTCSSILSSINDRRIRACLVMDAFFPVLMTRERKAYW